MAIAGFLCIHFWWAVNLEWWSLLEHTINHHNHQMLHSWQSRVTLKNKTKNTMLAKFVPLGCGSKSKKAVLPHTKLILKTVLRQSVTAWEDLFSSKCITRGLTSAEMNWLCLRSKPRAMTTKLTQPASNKCHRIRHSCQHLAVRYTPATEQLLMTKEQLSQ